MATALRGGALHLDRAAPRSDRCGRHAAPPECPTAADGSSYRDFIVVALILDRAELFPDNWIYIHSPDVRVGRMQNFNNWSAATGARPGPTCLGLEYFCSEGDDLWAMR